MNDVEEIARQAYYLWEDDGRPVGRDLDHWLRAEAQVKAVAPAVEKVAKPKAKRASATRKSK